MMSALYTGVSAMSSNQVKIDVISNNIANVNTIGYKYQTVNFSDTLYQMVSGATAPSETSGGIDPQQVGLGVTVASMNTVNTMGSLQYTGNSTDMAISGDGYFVVVGPDGEYNFTRAGNFGIDSTGNLVTADGYQVCGWQDVEIQDDGSYLFSTTSEPEPINIYSLNGVSSNTVAPNVTTEATLSGNLNASDEVQGVAIDDIGDVSLLEADYVIPMTVNDYLGGEHQINTEYYKCFSEENADGDVETSYYWQTVDEDDNTVAQGYIKFDSNGQLITDEVGFETSAAVTVDPGTGAGTSEFTYEMDFSTVTMYGSESNIQSTYVDGNTAGELMSFSVDANGIIMGVYSNGEQNPLGVLSLANFDNPAGLAKSGSNMYVETANSGEFTVGNTAGTGGTGQLSVGTLEMSNVDLSKEYSDLIVAQRGYQASASIISTVDELLQELINLKR
jgi:flagellar hook protein FlgE